MAVWSLSSLAEIRSNRRVDSEFFRPEYLSAEQRVRACNALELGRLGGFVPGPFGSAFHVQNYDFRSPYRYIRGKDVKPFFLLKDDNRYLPASDFHRLCQYEVRSDDLMISVVGTLGNVAICTEDDVPAMFSCKSTLFRSNEADPYFLLAYLNSAPGLLCMLRRQRGAIQAGLNMEDLRTIPVPRFGEEAEHAIAEDVRAAHRNLILSRQKYEAAQQLLESELGLDKLTFQKPVGYVAQFSEVQSSRRCDADYFQPMYKHLDAVAAKYPNKRIRAISEKLETGIYSSSYSLEGIPYIRGTDVSSGYVDDERVLRTSTLKSTRSTITDQGDILVTRVGSIGVCGIVENELADALFSDNLIRIRLTSDSKAELSAHYLNLLLNTTYGQMQMLRYSRGSVQQRLNQSQLAQIAIPVIRWESQQEIESLLKQHRKAMRQSRLLLKQAKSEVEQLIEAAVQS